MSDLVGNPKDRFSLDGLISSLLYPNDQTDGPRQTVQTMIRLLLEQQFDHGLQFAIQTECLHTLPFGITSLYQVVTVKVYGGQKMKKITAFQI